MADIPEQTYKEILKVMPVCCVDLVITHDNKFLLLKRGKQPAKGQWWLPGGRLLKNEKIRHAALRKAREETGLDCEFVKELGINEGIFDDGPFGFGVHTVGVVCMLKAKTGKVVLDSAHTDYKWDDKVDDSLDRNIVPFLLTAIG
jgi:ADP-ribose pyrophosphatase YjhB (NUDIX family)